MKQQSKKPKAPAGGPAKFTARGWRARNGGRVAYVEPPPEFEGTSVQVCGLWPFAAGAGAPMIGVPIGQELNTRATVCCDPYNWFRRTNLTNVPTEWIMGLPGLGKSSLVVRQALGLYGQGIPPLVLGDLKPDYVDIVRALGGGVVELGPGRGAINPLDPGHAFRAANRLTGDRRRALVADASARRVQIVAALMETNRQGRVTDVEESILIAGLDLLDQKIQPGQATLPHLVALIHDRPDSVADVVLARKDARRYEEIVDPLLRSLAALCHGRMGDTFARPTTVPLDINQPLCIDISNIGVTDKKLTAAVLLACWSEGFGAIAADHALADAGLEPQRIRFVVLDELWRALQAAPTIAERVDMLTRLNRQDAVALAMITHSLDDDRQNGARGNLAERAGIKITFGLPDKELPLLDDVVPLTQKERNMIVDWQTPPTWNQQTEEGSGMLPPGLGKCLIKVGARPGIAVQVNLTKAETALHDTNRRWRSEVSA